MTARRGSASTTAVLVVAAGLVGLVGCGDGGGNDGSSVVIDGPIGLLDYGQVCDRDASLSRAPAYTGAAPHPVVVFEPGSGNDPSDPASGPRLFESLSPEFEPLYRPEVGAAEIVACGERSEESPTDVVCPYDFGDETPFFRATYRYVVREARTGRVVGETEVAAAGGCPSSATVAFVGAKVYSKATEQQLIEALRPFASWSGQGTPTQSPAPEALVARGEPIVLGSVTMRPPADPDPMTRAVLSAYHAYWAGFATVFENGGEDIERDIGQFVTYEYLSVNYGWLSTSARTEVGSIALAPVVRPGTTPGPTGAEVAEVTVDDCVDSTGRTVVENGEPTGEIGVRHPESYTLAQQDGRYVVTGFADAIPGMCAASG